MQIDKEIIFYRWSTPFYASLETEGKVPVLGQVTLHTIRCTTVSLDA
jgi:hypothetical protein